MHAPITRRHLKLLEAAEAIRLDPDKVEAAFIARQLVQAVYPDLGIQFETGWV
jgi:hypothetical protein